VTSLLQQATSRLHAVFALSSLIDYEALRGLTFELDYLKVEEREGIQLWQHPSTGHPIFLLEDFEGQPLYLSGIMPL